MSTTELDRLRSENKRLRELLAWSDRERQRIENLACETLSDLVEEIGWTIDSRAWNWPRRRAQPSASRCTPRLTASSGGRRKPVADWRYNTRAWQRLRTSKLNASPLCEVCDRRGQIVPASIVDHKISIASGGDAFPALEGLMSMCPSCHGVKTAARDNPHAFGSGPKLAFKGCDLDGLPIDESHPFWGIGGSKTSN